MAFRITRGRTIIVHYARRQPYT